MNDENKPTTEAASSKPKPKEQQAESISLTKIKDSIKSAPGKASEAIKTGKGNSLIEKTQKLLSSIICSISSSCRYISLRQLLLTQTGKEKTSRSCMMVGALSALIFLVAGIFAKSTKHLLLAAAFIIGIVISSSFISKSGVDTSMPLTLKKRGKSKSGNKQKTKKSDPDDIIL